MMRRSVQIGFLILLVGVLAACQATPGGTLAPGPTGGQTPAASQTPFATQTSLPPTTEPPASTATSTAAPTGTPEGGAVSPGMLRYMNREFGYQVDVPAESIINADQPDLVRIDLPVAGGTTLSEKYLEISATRGQAQCSSPYAVGYDPAAIQSQNVVYNGIEFLEQSGSEGAAGSIYEFTSYSTLKNDLCLSLTFVLHSANPGVFDTPPPGFDPLGERAIFETILKTFAWTGD